MHSWYTLVLYFILHVLLLNMLSLFITTRSRMLSCQNWSLSNLKQIELQYPANFDSSRFSQTNTNIGSLLRTAAINLGRSDYDVSIFEARLEGDWYNETEQLKEEDVVTLSRYMPRLLAKEVHNILRVLSPESTKHLALIVNIDLRHMWYWYSRLF